tara:strand:- start:2227 stop:2442 length:216 start_codon:yes stop_codon:yes gene_type:complete
MDRLQQRRDQIRKRNITRYNAEKKIMRTYRINADLTRETTDEIEKALWELKDSMDLPTEEIELAIASRRLK